MIAPLRRRAFLATCLAGAATAAHGPLPALAQSKRMRFFWWGNQERAARTQAALDLFTSRHPDIEIDGETAPFGDFFTRLATQVVAGNPPDLVQMDFRYIAEYAHRGALLELDPYLGAGLDLADIPTDQVDANRVDGRLYGVSFGVNSAALMVNTVSWEAVGVPAPHHGMTYDAFAENAAKLSRDTPRANHYGTADASGIDIAFENWLKQVGKGLYTDDGRLAFEAADAAAWFDLWARMRAARACVPAEVQALDQGTTETSMIALGRAATTYALANALDPYQNTTSDRIAPAPYPVIGADARPGHYLRPATRLSIAAATSHPEEAVALLGFLTGDPEAARLLGPDRGFPVSPQLQEAMAPTLKETERLGVEYIAGLGDLIGSLPPQLPPGAGEVNELLREVSEQVAFDVLSPEDAGGSLVERAADILARAG